MKVFNDPVHGHIELPEFLDNIIDTPEFQRLRYIKQTGFNYYLFPGAAHNRFEHSIGVAYLAGKLIKHIADIQPELEISADDILSVQTAGLVHDLGHGPFSHSFELWTSKMGIPFQHEEMSIKLFNYIIDTYGIDDINVKLVSNLILPDNNHGFIYDIINNKHNYIDVDKFDYLLRDCHNSGVKASYDYNRLIKFSRVINDEICYQAKEAYNIYELFHTRYRMYKSVYYHRIARAIEHMYCDILSLIDPIIGLRDIINSAELFARLNDSIIFNSALNQAADNILKRIHLRDLYQMVDEIIDDKIVIRPIDIANGVNPDDIIIDEFIINYGYNPEKIKFYNKDINATFAISRDKISSFIPNRLAERYIRVYVKQANEVELVRNGLSRLTIK